MIILQVLVLVLSLRYTTLQVIFNHVIPDHLHSMQDVFWHGRRTVQQYNYIVEFILGGFTRWDSEYFLHIVHKPFHYALPFLSTKDVILVTAVIINLTAFVLAGLMLYKLTDEMFHRPTLSHITIILYCINPASVFMTSVYSESVFMLLVITGLYTLHCHHDWVAMVMFMLAGLTRSNGILLTGYFLWYYWLKLLSDNILIFLSTLSKLFVQISMVISSFVSFQLVAYWLFCHNTVTPLEWCEHTLPISYTYIQQHYWNNGWLRYYQLKQIPNFLLASPTIILCSYWLFCYYHSNWNKILKGYHHW